MNKKVSLSFRVDNGVVEHNNRIFLAKNVVPERIKDNIIYKQEDIKELYENTFSQALKEYNEKQLTISRHNRCINDYYEHLRKGKQEKPYYEVVVQIGDIASCGFGTENWNNAKEMLNEYMQDFEKRNPNMKVFNAVMHLDEATPHLHIDFVPICHNQKRGLSTRVSMKKALEEQGIKSKSKKYSEWQVWAENEKNDLKIILKKYDFIQEKKGAHYSHLTVDEYKNQKAQIEKLNNHIDKLKEKSVSELTSEEASFIKNQNDIMRTEIEKRDEKIRILSQRMGAKFTQFEIYSQDKIAFVSDELKKINIPVIEENNCIYVPEWAIKTTANVASKYQPLTNPTIRSTIQTDIDVLVYSSKSFEELLENLKEKGYELRQGKYLAIKHPQAQRFVRLKSLGDDYLPEKIKQRINLKDKFPNAVSARSKNANEIEQHYYTSIQETIVTVCQFKYTPRKTNPKKIYCYENDFYINQLTEQLQTMSEFKLNSREKIYSTAEETQNSINEKTEKIKSLSAELPQLKEDIEQIKALFSAPQNRPDTMQQLRLAVAKETAEKYGIKSSEDIGNLENRMRLIPTYISALKSEIHDEQIKLKKVSDVMKSYEEIISGNYIDNMIAAERERMERTTPEKKKQQNI